MSAQLGTGRLHGPGLTDVRMMTVAHTSFRRELRLGVPAVRNTQDGDLRRVAEVADHIDTWLGFLHHHHTIEDELLWDRLLTRLPADQARLIHLMEQQHATVARLLDGTAALLVGWRATGTSADGMPLADHLAELVERLCEHLDTEEAEVLPLMARHITAAEWEEFTARGMESIPKGLMLTGFGMMLYEGDPEAIALEIAKLPAPLRPILPPLGRWAFRRYAKRVHGTPSPAPGRS
jgi:hemerythrin-like domain-containing protein